MGFDYKGIHISWLGHDSFCILAEGTVIYTDPFRLTPQAMPGDLILVTHEHFDHCSPDDLHKVLKKETVIFAATQCEEPLAPIHNEKIFMRPVEEQPLDGTTIKAVAAYNTNKFKSPGQVYHPKEDAKLGFLLTITSHETGEKRTIYIAGDTDFIPEMHDIRCDVALLPVSGTYVMTAEEAANAARTIKPKVAIPMHYGAIVGDEHDAQEFAQYLRGTGIQVELLEKE